jgi:ATP-binding cassette subfamily B protein
VLDAVSLKVEPGEHVGVVGHSGAGKSALMGLLLGWYEPSEGAIRIDGAPLDRQELARLRTCTAWIDPQVHLFRATLLDNLCYGNGTPDRLDRMRILDEAGLIGMLRHLPEGMLTQLGEGGALLAGGEGQRIRIARALAKDTTRLAILDEPWRGLPRATRTRLLRMVRERFTTATLLFVTHDIRDTLALDRVVVLQSSRIIEQGAPEQLAADHSSHYRALLDAQEQAERDVWSQAHWRSLRLRSGKIEPLLSTDERVRYRDG